MNEFRSRSVAANGTWRWWMLAALLAAVGAFGLAPIANANHTVQLEGDSDFDDDGLLGDADGDFVFGTLERRVRVVGRGYCHGVRLELPGNGKRFP